MSDLLYSWLNDEIQLSRRITNFEADFSNGYLLGQVLSRYSQQLNFSEFVDRNDRESRINNFKLLVDSFKNLRVTFNSNIAMDIINQTTGVAKKVLYQLKMQFEKTNSNAFTKLTKMTKTLSPLKKIQVSKEKFDQVSKEHFSRHLAELHPAQNYILQRNKLKKFTDFQAKQILTIGRLQQKANEEKLAEKAKFREMQRNNLQKSADFRNEWEKANREKWEVNMAVRKGQHDKDRIYRHAVESHKIQSRKLAELEDLHSIQEDISKFESKLGKGNQEDAVVQSKTSVLKLPKKGIKLGKEQSPLKPKKKPLREDTTKQQREKKRRKMIVEQNKRSQLIQLSRRERYIMATIQQTSKQEKELEYQIWRAWQNKEVIVENRRLEDQKEKEKQEMREINAKFKREEMLRTLRQEHQQEVEDDLRRLNKFTKDFAIKKRKHTYQQCESIVRKFMEIAESCFQICQNKNIFEPPKTFLEHAFAQFVEDTTDDKSIAELQLYNYIHGTGEWALLPRRQGQPEEPTEDNAIPSKATNNYYLGNILRTLFSQILTSQPPTQSSQVTPQFLICLGGLQHSGKKQLAARLSQHFGFNVIEIQQLVQRALVHYDEIKIKGIDSNGLLNKLHEAAYQCAAIPQSLIVDLICQELSNKPKSVLVNYPTTNEQAIGLTQRLGSVGPSDQGPPDALNLRIQGFSRLVWPNETNITPRPLQHCGIDMVLWVNISSRVSIDRMLGLRTCEGNMVHIMAADSDNVYDLESGERGSALILRNNHKINSLPQVAEWFDKFGLKIEEENIEDKCWMTINGEISLDQLTEQVFEIVDGRMKNKVKIEKRKVAQRQEAERMEQEKQQQLEKEEEERKKCIKSSEEKVKDKLEKALQSVKMPEEFLRSTSTLWGHVEQLTISSLVDIFGRLHLQQKDADSHIAHLKKYYIAMLTRPDQKQKLAKDFQRRYNQFVKQNRDMVCHEYTKQELHQRADDLEDQLLALVQEKKEEAIHQRNNVINSGWLESQLDQIHLCAHTLLQSELYRCLCSEKIITDYYSKKYGIVKENEDPPLDIPYDSSLEAFKEDGFPRLHKLYSEALRVFNREEEVIEDKNKKGGKQPPKKDDKKGTKKGIELEEKSEPTAEEQEMKRAINNEKAIFRYRAGVIKEYAQAKIEKFRLQATQLYRDMEDLYIYTHKAETQAVGYLTGIFKKAIEQQRALENEVRIDYVEIIQDMTVRNFEKEKPVILPAQEDLMPNRFTIALIRSVLGFLINESPGNKISVLKARKLFFNIIQNPMLKRNLPQNWQNLQPINLEKFIRKADREECGYIELWKILMTIVLSEIKVPLLQEAKDFGNQLSQYGSIPEVDLTAILKAPAWFDEQLQPLENARSFPRSEYLKELLFQVFGRKQKNGLTTLEVEKFIESLTMMQTAPEEEKKTYFQMMFL